MGTIYLNEEAYGGGGTGGGNSITYGVNVNPSAQANDGDLYMLLGTDGKKQGEFLYQTDRWNLIDGREQVVYLPHSKGSKVICEAYKDIYDGTTNWGTGKNPATLSAAVSQYSEDSDALYIPTKSSGTLLYIDLERTDRISTAYVVMRGPDLTGYNRIISCLKSRANYQGICCYGNPITFSTFGDSLSTGISCNTNFAVIVARFNGSSIYLNVNNSYRNSISSRTNYGRYFTIGRTDIDSNTQYAEPSDTAVKYFAMVDEAESDDVIANNVSYLMGEFNVA